MTRAATSAILTASSMIRCSSFHATPNSTPTPPIREEAAPKLDLHQLGFQSIPGTAAGGTPPLSVGPAAEVPSVSRPVLDLLPGLGFLGNSAARDADALSLGCLMQFARRNPRRNGQSSKSPHCSSAPRLRGRPLTRPSPATGKSHPGMWEVAGGGGRAPLANKRPHPWGSLVICRVLQAPGARLASPSGARECAGATATCGRRFPRTRLASDRR